MRTPSPRSSTTPVRCALVTAWTLAAMLPAPMRGDAAEARQLSNLTSAGPGSVARVIDLETALRLAGADNLSVAYFRERVREARAGENAAGLWYLPELSFGLNYTKHDGRTQSTEGRILDVTKGSASDALMLETTLDPVAARFEELAARQDRRAVEAERDQELNEVLERAAFGYYELVRAGELTAIAEEAIRRSGGLLEHSESLLRRGAGLEVEVVRARARLARDQQGLLQAQKAMAVAAARLARTLHLSADTELRPAAGPLLKLALTDEAQSLETLIARALANRPEVHRSRALAQSAGHRESAARWRPYTPEVGASAGFGYFGGGPAGRLDDFSDRTDATLFLRWRWEGFGLVDRERRAATRSQKTQAELQVEQVEEMIQTELVETRQSLFTLARQIDAAAEEETAAQKSLELTEVRFKGGAGLQLEVLEAQHALVTARAARLAAIIEYNQMQHRLLRLLGGVAAQTEAGPGNTTNDNLP